MTDWNDDYDAYEDREEKNLLADLRKQLKEGSKARKDLEDELAKLRAKTRVRSVADVLSARGVNRKLATLVPESIGEDEEAVGKWLDEYSDVLGLQAGEQSTNKPADGDTSVTQTSAIDPQEQAAMARIAQTGGAGVPPASSYEETMTRLKSANHDDLLRMIAEAKGASA